MFHKLAWIFLAALTGIWACSGSPDIPEALVKKEFRHAWTSIHGKNGEKGYRWQLTSLSPGTITIKEGGKSASVRIRFKYLDASGHAKERQGDFNFIKKGETWELEDRNARSMSSPTRYQITP